MIMIKLFNMTFVTIGFTLIAITLIILTTNSSKFVFSVAVKFSHLFIWKVIITFTCVCFIFLNKINIHNNNKSVKTLNNKSSFLLKPSENSKLLVNQFNNASPGDNTDPENVVQFKYYDIDELQNMKIPNKDKSWSFFV